VGIDSDRLFPVAAQQLLAEHLPNGIDGRDAVVLRSDFGHDGFLIENDLVGPHLARLLAS
jgi:homoserine O-acetyltransferase